MNPPVPATTIDELHDHDRTVRLTVHGDLDLATTGLIHRRVTDALRQRPGRVIVDLHDVAFLGAAGVNDLLAGYRAAAQSGVRYTVAGARGIVQYALEITGVLEAFACRPDATAGT